MKRITRAPATAGQQMNASRNRGLLRAIFSVGLLLCAGSSTAGIIIDDLVDSSNSWTATCCFGPFGAPGTFITPVVQDGVDTPAFNDEGQTIQKAGGFPAHTLQVGTYTIEFAVGNYSNFPGSVLADVNFTGLNLAGAASASTPQPLSGGWALWQIGWNVAAGNPVLGNPLSFQFNTLFGTTNGPFDGVGSLSTRGTGFLVDFVPAEGVPEPATLALFGLGLAGLGGACRRRKLAR